MNRLMMLLLVSSVAGPLHARLPPPAPEQEALAAQKKAEEAEAAKRQQEALTRVQDRLGARFGKGGSTAERTGQGQLPQKAVQTRGDAGPTGGKEQSAEAHSVQKH